MNNQNKNPWCLNCFALKYQFAFIMYCRTKERSVLIENDIKFFKIDIIK